ncbi:MAG: hypothetical protein ACM3U2_20885, partial [Deltaproteobacteria bacterium]
MRALTMDNKNRKLSPVEFLAQLKAGGKGSKHLAKKGTRSPGEQKADSSDRAAPGDGTAAAQSATAVADPEAARGRGPSANESLPKAIETSLDGSGNLVPAPGQLNELFERVNELLDAPAKGQEAFKPAEPQSVLDTGLTPDEIEQLILKYLLARGSTTGRKIAQ